MKFKQGDIVDVEGYLGEVIKVTDTYIEVLYGGEALHYCIEKYDINDERVVLVTGESNE
jgi:preprotein translocase subunit YajC